MAMLVAREDQGQQRVAARNVRAVPRRGAARGRGAMIGVVLLVGGLVAGCGAASTPSPASSGTPAGAPASGAIPSASPAVGGAESPGAAASQSGGSTSSPASVQASGQPSASGVQVPTNGSTFTTGASTAAGSAAEAAALQSQFVSVIHRVNPSVVLIETSSGLGSGIVFDSRGDIVTNAHVAGTSTSFTVTLATGRTVKGTLVGEFVPNDIAVIKVSATGLQPATFGDSSNLAVGDIVLAMGNPLGLQSSVTEGIVSALGRTVSEPNGAALPDVIQTSAAINPGNSGGALVDLNGHVVGIPTLAASDPQMGGAAAGIGFAIPGNIARDLASQIIRYGKVIDSHRAFLGIESADLSAGGGALVYSTVAGGPAAKAGLKAGDIITAVDGQPTPSAGALAAVLAGLKPGQTVPVDVMHQDGSQSTVRVTLGQLPG
jgi:putative serine protease PepD